MNHATREKIEKRREFLPPLPIQWLPETTPENLRQRIVRVPLSAALDCLAGRRKLTNYPAGAKLISAWFDSEMDGSVEMERVLCLRIEHESFPTFPAGCKIPLFAAIIEKGKS